MTRGIILNTQEVRSILAGATMIVRPIQCNLNDWHIDSLLGDWPLSRIHGVEDGVLKYNYQTDVDDFSTAFVKCPLGKPGDSIYVREQIKLNRNPKNPRAVDPRYIADNKRIDGMGNGFYIFPKGEYCSANFMPRWASRLTLEIVSVSVKRVQDWTEDDLYAMGYKDCPLCHGSTEYEQNGDYVTCPCTKNGDYMENEFKRDWHSRHSKRGLGWDINPWCWQLSVKRIEKGGE